MSVVDEAIRAIRDYIGAELTRDEFTPFFRDGLLLPAADAQRLTWYYLATCRAFELEAGLSGSRYTQIKANRAKLEEELRRLQIGTLFVGNTQVMLKLRISDFLQKHATALGARKEMSPAKRDSLRMEGMKLLNVKKDAWIALSRSTAIGVRG